MVGDYLEQWESHHWLVLWTQINLSPRLEGMFNGDSPFKVLLSPRLDLICVRETVPSNLKYPHLYT